MSLITDYAYVCKYHYNSQNDKESFQLQTLNPSSKQTVKQKQKTFGFTCCHVIAVMWTQTKSVNITEL